MKSKILVIYICFFSISSGFAHNWFVGGSFALDFFSVEESNHAGTTSNMWGVEKITFSPTVGYKFDRFDFGINPIFRFQAGRVTAGSALRSWEMGTGLFSRFNFVSFGNFSILGNISLEYLYSISHFFEFAENTHKIGINLKPVFEYRLTDRISVFTDFGIGGIGGSYRNYSRTPWTPEFSGSGNYPQNRRVFSLHAPSIFNVNITEFALGFHVHF